MECLNGAPRCAICGTSRNSGETWFLISENCWEDRLKIWRWTARMAGEMGMHSVCSQRHARELVVHWMTTGCLYYPFATVPNSRSSGRAATGKPSASAELPCRAEELGELAVDREAIRRALVENPLSLNTILDELAMVLESETIEVAEPDLDEIAPLSRTV